MSIESLTSPNASSEASVLTPLAIAGVSEATVLRYFETLNASNFQATGKLFAAEGMLQPPFEKPVVGAEAIVAYLQAEAKDLILQPRQGNSRLLEDGSTEITVTGKVQTPLFSVNVSWLFMLDHEHNLLLAKIKLLASPQELLSLRS
ncbi:MAG: ketosteroid isomerase family protein [Leptolyngbya sp. BL-A-14]